MVSDNERLNLLLELRRYADAEKLAREAIGRDPQWAPGYTHLARALINLGNKGAIDAAREGARRAPGDAWAVGTLSCALNWFGRYPEALEAAEQAVKLDPRYPWAYTMLANVLYNLNRFKECREAAAAGLRCDPLNEGLIRWKGWADHKLGEQAEALRTAEEGLKHHPNSHLLLNLIGCVKWTLAEQAWGRKRLQLHRAADELIRGAMRLDPSQSAYRDNLRGNARSCRVNLLTGLLLAGGMLLSLIPVLGLGVVLLIPDRHRLAALAVVTLVVLATAAAVAGSERCALATPLDWFGAPAVPLDPRERRLGRLELGLCGLLFLVPYIVLAILVAA